MSTFERGISTHMFEAIARTIGGSVTADRVEKVIDLTNEYHFIFHGIKSEINVQAVLNNGVAPLTPESGRSSHWTTGWRLFVSDPNYSLCTFDTTFFHYGHSNSDGRATYMTIVVSNQQAISPIYPVKIAPNSELTIPVHVPRDLIHVLRIQLHHGGVEMADILPRQWGQLAEQNMFDLVERVVTGGFTPGNLTIAESPNSEGVSEARI